MSIPVWFELKQRQYKQILEYNFLKLLVLKNFKLIMSHYFFDYRIEF